jgi:hypothetical protein
MLGDVAIAGAEGVNGRRREEEGVASKKGKGKSDVVIQMK